MAKAGARKKAAAKRRTRAAKPAEREEQHFAKGLLTRGEAVPEPPPGRDLPPGATHTFERDAAKDGAVPPASALRRRRFSLR
ncbi:MAG: hypothetical protein ACHQPI_08650 [Thermoanaerobaculia bacterium]